MRHRRSHRSVLFPALLLSALIHAVAYWPVSRVLEDYFAHVPPRGKGPVEVVRLAPEVYDRAMEQARQAAARSRRTDRSKNHGKAPPGRPPKPERKKPEPDKSKDLPDRQIVDVPATKDDSPNPDAKYLGKFNSNVDKESVARIEDRDPSRKRTTHKLQDRSPSARPDTPKAPGLEIRSPSSGGGTGGSSDSAEKGQGEGDEGGKKRFALEVPDLKRRDDVQLKLSDLPDFGQALKNQQGRSEVRGNSDRFKVEPGDPNGDSDRDGEASGGGKGTPGLPNLDALRPRLGTVGRIAGSPSSDYIENVPEGDGTFLNTKEFKYATFFIRVKDSVEGHWHTLTRQEYRRRDPTGRIYGQRNRSTLLTVVLDDAGRLGSVRIAESCGLDFLDQAAVEAFRRAQPFPNPPDGIIEDDGNVRFNFQFVVVFRPSGPFGGLGY